MQIINHTSTCQLIIVNHNNMSSLAPLDRLQLQFVFNYTSFPDDKHIFSDHHPDIDVLAWNTPRTPAVNYVSPVFSAALRSTTNNDNKQQQLRSTGDSAPPQVPPAFVEKLTILCEPGEDYSNSFKFGSILPDRIPPHQVKNNEFIPVCLRLVLDRANGTMHSSVPAEVLFEDTAMIPRKIDGQMKQVVSASGAIRLEYALYKGVHKSKQSGVTKFVLNLNQMLDLDKLKECDKQQHIVSEVEKAEDRCHELKCKLRDAERELEHWSSKKKQRIV
jgi:hypothetical protein